MSESMPVQASLSALEGPAGDNHVRDVSLLRIANVLLRNWRLLVVLPLVSMLLALGITILSPSAYTAESVVLPQVAAPSSRIAGLAAQLGLGNATGPAGETLEFYAQVMRSRDLLRELATREYSVPADDGTGGGTGTLVELLEVEGETNEAREARTIDILRQHMAVQPSSTTGLITVRVRTPWPTLSEQVTRQLLEEVGEFNLARRQAQAAAERAFVEERLAEAGAELVAAEDELKHFMEQNRRYEESPDLRFEATRLQRRVDLKQQIYTSLAQGFEQARIEEVRNTPLLTIIDAPERSARPARSGLVLRLLIAFVLGLVIAMLFAFGRQALEQQRAANPAEYAEFVERGAMAITRLSPAFLKRGRGEALESSRARHNSGNGS